MNVTIAYNARTSEGSLRCGDSSVFEYIRAKFSVENNTARFQSRFAAKRKYAITPGGKFEAGLMLDIIAALKSYSDLINITLEESAKSFLKAGFSIDLEQLNNKNYNLHYYQSDIIQTALKNGRGVCVLGTGGGKTLTIATLISNIYSYYNKNPLFKCLLLVPDIGLVSQTYNDFKEYNVPFNICRWATGFDVEDDANVIIASNKIILSRFDSEDWIKYVDIVVVDECHKIKKDNKIGKVLKKIKTSNKYGFTGTMPTEKIDIWSIIGKIGPVYYEKAGKELRKEGFLSAAEVKALKISYIKKPKTHFTEEEFTPTARYRAELDFIYVNQFRNKIIRSVCTNFKNNSLILVNHIAHGEELYKVLSEIQNREVFFVQGAVDLDSREIIKQKMEESSNVICIAMTSIFSTGINIKNIHMVMFASGGKAFIRMVQSIGRGLRKHHTKDKLLIIDLIDDLKYGNDHFEKRQEIYIKEHIPFNITNINELRN